MKKVEQKSNKNNLTEKIKLVEKILRERGLTEKQIEIGKKYYINFASKHNISPERAAGIIIKMIRNIMRSLTSNQ